MSDIDAKDLAALSKDLTKTMSAGFDTVHEKVDTLKDTMTDVLVRQGTTETRVDRVEDDVKGIRKPGSKPPPAHPNGFLSLLKNPTFMSTVGAIVLGGGGLTYMNTESNQETRKAAAATTQTVERASRHDFRMRALEAERENALLRARQASTKAARTTDPVVAQEAERANEIAVEKIAAVAKAASVDVE